VCTLPDVRLLRPFAIRLLLTGAALALLALLAYSTSIAMAQPPSPLEVGPGKQYSTIGAAVAAAPNGATIQVAAGTYSEAVTIAKPLTLKGAGAATTTIDSGGKDNTVHIKADNVRLEGFTIKGSRLDGVLVENAKGAQVVNNTITGNASLVIPQPPPAPAPIDFSGINLRNSSNALVENNDVSNNGGRGIRTEGSALWKAPEQGVDIFVEGRSDNNVIRNNKATNNATGCGIVISTDSSNNIIEGNTVTGNPSGIIISGLPPFGIPDTPFAGHVPSSSGNTVQNNTVQNNTAGGILVAPIIGSANNNVVSGNKVSGNGPGFQAPQGKAWGIQVSAGERPPSKADSNIVGPGNVISDQDVGIYVAGVATNTQIFGNQITVRPGGIDILLPPPPAPPPALPTTGGSPAVSSNRLWPWLAVGIGALFLASAGIAWRRRAWARR